MIAALALLAAAAAAHRFEILFGLALFAAALLAGAVDGGGRILLRAMRALALLLVPLVIAQCLLLPGERMFPSLIWSPTWEALAASGALCAKLAALMLGGLLAWHWPGAGAWSGLAQKLAARLPVPAWLGMLPMLMRWPAASWSIWRGQIRLRGGVRSLPSAAVALLARANGEAELRARMLWLRWPGGER